MAADLLWKQGKAADPLSKTATNTSVFRWALPSFALPWLKERGYAFPQCLECGSAMSRKVKWRQIPRTGCTSPCCAQCQPVLGGVVFILGKFHPFCVKMKQKHLPVMMMGKLNYSFLFSPPILLAWPYIVAAIATQAMQMQGLGFISFEKNRWENWISI